MNDIFTHFTHFLLDWSSREARSLAFKIAGSLAADQPGVADDEHSCIACGCAECIALGAAAVAEKCDASVPIEPPINPLPQYFAPLVEYLVDWGFSRDLVQAKVNHAYGADPVPEAAQP